MLSARNQTVCKEGDVFEYKYVDFPEDNKVFIVGVSTYIAPPTKEVKPIKTQAANVTKNETKSEDASANSTTSTETEQKNETQTANETSTTTDNSASSEDGDAGGTRRL